MTKSDKKPADAISLAALCDTKAGELRESLPTIAELFTDAAMIIRMQHAALSATKCLHVITFTVTKEMNEKGRDMRAPGKYCMTCGEMIPKPPKPPKAKPDNKEQAAGESSDDVGDDDQE